MIRKTSTRLGLKRRGVSFVPVRIVFRNDFEPRSGTILKHEFGNDFVTLSSQF